MPKLSEFLKTVLAPTFKKPEDLELFVSASALRDIEVPDEVASEFNNKYLTRERAITDEDLVKKFNKEARGYVFGSVDQKLKKIKGKLSEDDQRAIDAEQDTLVKMELLERALDNLGKGSGAEETKKISEAARKREAELHEKISALEGTLKQKDSNFTNEIKGVKLDYALKSMLSSFELAPEFSSDKHKSFLADSTINSLKKNYILEFDDKDDSIIQLRKNVDGVITDVYEGNNKLSLTDVLKKEYEPYTKKSTPGDHKNTPPPPPRNELPTDQPLTLRDRIKAAAAESGQ
jgi:hypothetical protein